MDILSSLYSILTGNVLSFIVVLSIVVFVHEMGHYLVGKWCGIHATTFSIGFGKELFGFTDKSGTRWRLALIPLGGYVKFFGDQNATSASDGTAIEMSEADKARSFYYASVGRRALTVLAGPMANFILTILIFTAMFATFGRQIADPIISEVVAQSPAEKAGLQKGDLFVAVDGIEVIVFQDLKRYISSRPETEVAITVKRNGQDEILTLIPDRIVSKDRFGNEIEEGRMGVMVSAEGGNFRQQIFTVPEAVGQAFSESWFIVTRTFDYIGNILVGRESAKQLSGPIGIAKISGQVATLGVLALVQLMAVISLSIGLLNLMPIPILDGGHLVFYAFEAMLGRPLSLKTQDYALRVGIMILLSLMIFTTFNDVGSIYKNIVGS
ncbi:RIP metalloprotease RseP [Lentilitoribacter sp. EG35]|uniref:RIP metalloprotease RseP n=1 Tax=Lentilitoribacter sp. EG35 TaxID=3234192 RepID=UPI0034607531